MSRFIDPTTDFGFKKLFGEETNKAITLSFVNAVLELESPLRDLNFSNIERLPETAEERKGIYDVFCEDAEGSHFLIEMQKNRMAFIKDRLLYYSTFPIVAQAKRGKPHFYAFPYPKTWVIRDVATTTYGGKEMELPTSAATNWDFELKAIYCIAVLGYALDGSKKAVNRNSLRNDEPPHDSYYDKLKFITVELPLFDERMPEYSLDRPLNKWLFFLEYLPMLDDIPEMFKNDPVFRKAFYVAELANLTPKERREYEINVKYMRDTYAMLSTSYNMGKEEGIMEGEIKGRIEGKTEGKIETILMLLSQKLGSIPSDIEAAIRTVSDKEQVNAILGRFGEINDWEAVRAYLPAPKT